MAKKQSCGGGAGDSYLHGPPAKKAAVFIGSAAALLSALAAVAVLITPAPEITARTSWSSSSAPEITAAAAVEEEEECDVFDGSWVFDDDDAGRPLYSGDVGGCRYITDDFACDKWGRKDRRYQQWRWQPRRCDLPRFDGKRLLERLRGKRMVFVGDSINRNQFFSMVCLLDSHLPHQPLQSIGYDHGSSFLTYKAVEYNATIEFYWSPLLVESNRDSPENYSPVRTIVIRGGGAAAVERHARRWGGADIVVFDSYLWWKWNHHVDGKLFNRPLMEDDVAEAAVDIELIDGFRQSLKGLSEWLELHLEPHQEAYFMSQSPTHFWIEEPGQAGGRSCYNETELVTEAEYRDRAGTDGEMAKAVADVFGGFRGRGFRNIRLLNITRMSECRKDGHPTIFKKFWHAPRAAVEADAIGFSDCSHWCLPGVPDVWNELLYYHIIHKDHPTFKFSK